jgi:hypothetical protein
MTTEPTSVSDPNDRPLAVSNAVIGLAKAGIDAEQLCREQRADQLLDAILANAKQDAQRTVSPPLSYGDVVDMLGLLMDRAARHEMDRFDQIVSAIAMGLGMGPPPPLWNRVPSAKVREGLWKYESDMVRAMAQNCRVMSTEHMPVLQGYLNGTLIESSPQMAEKKALIGDLTATIATFHKLRARVNRRPRRGVTVEKRLTPKQTAAIEAVSKCNGNFTAAAKLLGVKSPKTVRQAFNTGYAKLGLNVTAKLKAMRQEAKKREGRTVLEELKATVADGDEGQAPPLQGKGRYRRDRRM